MIIKGSIYVRIFRNKYLKSSRRIVWPSLLLLFIFLGLIISCAPELKSLPDQVQLPDQFSATGVEHVPEMWWTSLDDPRLNDLVERALQGNFSLKKAWDRLDQARAYMRKQGAGIQPSLSATASASRSVQEAKTSVKTGSSNTERAYQDEFSLGFSASYEVDLWGRVHAVRDAASLDAQATEQDLQAAALSLSAQTANAWYLLVEQRAQIRLLDRQIGINNRYSELVELRFRKGEVSVTDVLQQQKLLKAKETERVAAQTKLETLEHQVAVLMGSVPGRTEIPEGDRLPELPPLPRTGLPSEWVKKRPDIRSAFLRVQARDKETAFAVAERFPVFTISGLFQTSALEPALLFEQWLASIAGRLAAPLLDGGKRKAEVDRARAALSEALHEYGQTVIEGIQEVEDALTSEREQRKVVEGVQDQLDLSNRTLRHLLEKYKKGRIDFLKVLDELRTQQELERNILSARRQLIQDRIDLYLALGGTRELTREVTG